jgi:hypothetical protein
LILELNDCLKYNTAAAMGRRDFNQRVFYLSAIVNGVSELTAAATLDRSAVGMGIKPRSDK